MKTIIVVFACLFSAALMAQSNGTEHPNTYWQVKVDFLEPIINQGFVARFDYGKDRHLGGLVLGLGGRVSEFDNQQFETFQDEMRFKVGLEYQYFLSANKRNRGFYIGADVDYANRRVTSKISDESVDNIHVITPGVWFGWVWKPFKNADFIVDLTIVHPRYDFGKIDDVDFDSVSENYQPQNLFNFLGPWSIGWRF